MATPAPSLAVCFPAPTPSARAALIIELRRHLEFVALRLVVVDPEPRPILGKDVGELLHRGQRLLLVEVRSRYPAIVPVALEVHSIARQHDLPGPWQLHQQR